MVAVCVATLATRAVLRSTWIVPDIADTRIVPDALAIVSMPDACVKSTLLPLVWAIAISACSVLMPSVAVSLSTWIFPDIADTRIVADALVIMSVPDRQEISLAVRWPSLIKKKRMLTLYLLVWVSFLSFHQFEPDKQPSTRKTQSGFIAASTRKGFA